MEQDGEVPLPAVEKVFSTYELAEVILSRLPRKDILPAMRINKTTRNIIESSKLIHSRLYWLKPTPSNPYKMRAWYESEDDQTSPRTMETLLFDNRHMETVLPMANYFGVMVRRGSQEDRKILHLEFRIYPANLIIKPDRLYVKPKPGDENAMWRKMRVFGCPHETECGMAWWRVSTDWIRVREGVTLGEIYDLVCQTRRQDEIDLARVAQEELDSPAIGELDLLA